MMIYTSLWAVLALAVLMLAAYRKMKAGAEDDTVHVSGANWNVIDKQQTVSRTMEQIDRWGKILTIVTVAYGLVLLGIYLWSAWQEGQKFSF